MLHPFTRTARVTALAAIALLSGCASMSEQECLSADWHDRGMRDGHNGQPRHYVEAHREACAKVGVVPDELAYRTGHAVGIRQYCTPENGGRVGRRGSTYRQACPAELEGAFLDRYRAGYRVYEAEQRVRSIDSDIQHKERALDKEKNEDKRRRLRRDLRDLDDRLRRARHDLHDAERRERRY